MSHNITIVIHDTYEFVQTYVFEIIEVVPDPELAPQRSYRLRLHCRDEAKGPVSVVCGINGYLVSSAGQKVGSQSHVS